MMVEVFGNPTPPSASSPDDAVCSFTANVGCLSCCSAILMSWRAEEKIHPTGVTVMRAFRRLHGRGEAFQGDAVHPGFFEGFAAVGIHKASDSCPPGTTLLNTVSCRADPNNVGHVLFGQTGPPTQYVRSIYDAD